MKNLIILYLNERIERKINKYYDHLINDHIIRYIEMDVENIIDDLFNRNLLKKDRSDYFFDVNVLNNYDIEIKFKRELNG